MVRRPILTSQYYENNNATYCYHDPKNMNSFLLQCEQRRVCVASLRLYWKYVHVFYSFFVVLIFFEHSLGLYSAPLFLSFQHALIC